MLLLDVSVVVAVHRADHPRHAALQPWFEALVASSEPFSVPTVVWASFLRLTTNRRVFAIPTPLSEAFDFVDAVCAQPNHLLLSPGPRHLTLLRRLCEEAAASGDLVPDAVIAAVALEYGCDVATFDLDFARFSSIDHVVPSDSS